MYHGPRSAGSQEETGDCACRERAYPIAGACATSVDAVVPVGRSASRRAYNKLSIGFEMRVVGRVPPRGVPFSTGPVSLAQNLTCSCLQSAHRDAFVRWEDASRGGGVPAATGKVGLLGLRRECRSSIHIDPWSFAVGTLVVYIFAITTSPSSVQLGGKLSVVSHQPSRQ